MIIPKLTQLLKIYQNPINYRDVYISQSFFFKSFHKYIPMEILNYKELTLFS